MTLPKGELHKIRCAVEKLTNHYSEIKVELGWHRRILMGVVATLLSIAAAIIVFGITG